MAIVENSLSYQDGAVELEAAVAVALAVGERREHEAVLQPQAPREGQRFEQASHGAHRTIWLSSPLR